MKKIDTLVLATRNKHKVEEISAMLAGLSITVKDLSQFPSSPDVVEDGETLEENALKKARAAFEHTNLPVIADDTGLEVYYLLGEPGVYSARYAGETATYEDNNRLLLRKLNQVPERRRQARFRAVIALVGPGFSKTVEGICEGKILFDNKGNNGFGYDPIFQPIGHTKTFAEMSADEKNSLSHRSRAIEKLKELLTTLS